MKEYCCCTATPSIRKRDFIVTAWTFLGREDILSGPLTFKYLLKWESPHKDRSHACACLSSIPFAQHVRLSLGSFPNLGQRSRARAHVNEARRAGSETSQRSLEIFSPKWSSTASQDEKLHLPPPEVFLNLQCLQRSVWVPAQVELWSCD